MPEITRYNTYVALQFDCPHCRTPLTADAGQFGQLVRCPACHATLTLPPPPPQPAGPATAPALAATASVSSPALPTPPPLPAGNPRSTFGSLPPGHLPRRFAFTCPYCASRLDANESLSGRTGMCPTCASEITIPLLDRFGRTIDPTSRKVIRPDPHPVHAYAAAGASAPRLRRLPDGRQVIVCPRCSAHNPVTADACAACAVPFTLEGTRGGETSHRHTLATASLVLGIASIPAFCLILAGPLAVLFGSIALYRMQGTDNPPRSTAIIGVACGLIGSFFSLTFLLG